MRKIDFSYTTEEGFVYRDAIYLEDDFKLPPPLYNKFIEDIKEKRINAWKAEVRRPFVPQRPDMPPRPGTPEFDVFIQNRQRDLPDQANQDNSPLNNPGQ